MLGIMNNMFCCADTLKPTIICHSCMKEDFILIIIIVSCLMVPNDNDDDIFFICIYSDTQYTQHNISFLNVLYIHIRNN